MSKAVLNRSRAQRARWVILLLGTTAATMVASQLLGTSTSNGATVSANQSLASAARPKQRRANVSRGVPLASPLGVDAPSASASVRSDGAGEETPRAEPSADDYLDKAKTEPRDDSWAEPTERLFEEDLKVKAQRLDFRVGNVECHTNNCVAELFWSSLRDARADFKEALGAPERSGCRPRLLLTEGAPEDAPEMGTMLLHCQAVRERAARNAGVVPVDREDEM